MRRRQLQDKEKSGQQVDGMHVGGITGMVDSQGVVGMMVALQAVWLAALCTRPSSTHQA
jgi:hypothetical protein